MKDEPRTLEGRRILVVEDDYLVALTVVELLEDAGAEVIGPYSNAQEAVAMVTSGAMEIDAGILDVNLDGETSFPVADALAARQIFFIFATGYGGSVLGDPYQNYPRCQKPFDPADLFQRLAVGTAAQAGEQVSVSASPAQERASVLSPGLVDGTVAQAGI
ncbi:response regulator [Bordetella sp. LUAb4]|uniref:response regulator n=1 Tax=Bordetella sp. LUAb4 TaxID=2843195 RepID=UPI001E3D260A|nr:response regulator [Bordetella sp. LUAb4]